MVDIMLVLLIIFMVVTPLLQHGVTVNLPKDLNNPEEDPRIIKDTSIVIAIPEDGEYYIGKDKIAKEYVERQSPEDVGQHQEGRRQGSSTSRAVQVSVMETWSMSSTKSGRSASIRSVWSPTRRKAGCGAGCSGDRAAGSLIGGRVRR